MAMWVIVLLAFGMLCGRYVSVVGFMLSAVLVILFASICSMVGTTSIGYIHIILGGIALQVGYFGFLLGNSLIHHVPPFRLLSRTEIPDRVTMDLRREKTEE